jgi:aryl-alcohol dehydrogenase-like predicted oxidoreductase
MALTGKATQRGTARYRARFPGFAPDFFRQSGGWTCASIGIGTHGGALSDEGDRRCVTAVVDTVLSGGNVIDTSSNYRCMRSEPTVAVALSQLESKGIDRSEIVIATKGGFIPWDQASLENPRGHIDSRYLSARICEANEIVDGKHCLASGFLRDQLGQSLARLKVPTVDVYFIHNPEFQLTQISRAALWSRLTAAFESLEEEGRIGRLQVYGVATWNGLRVPRDSRDFLDLDELIGIAESVAGSEHRFRAVQFPFSLAMPEALVVRNQDSGNGEPVSLLEFCAARDLIAFTSVPLAQGQLSGLSSRSLSSFFPDLDKPAQAALQFARSAMGVTTALVGMTSEDHIRENLALAHTRCATREILEMF